MCVLPMLFLWLLPSKDEVRVVQAELETEAKDAEIQRQATAMSVDQIDKLIN